MLSVFDIFNQKDGAVYYGILDDTTNTVTYYDSYTLKNKIKDNDEYRLGDLKVKALNSVGFGIGTVKTNLKKTDGFEYKDIKEYTFVNIPLQFVVIHGFMRYTLVESSICGRGWSLQIKEIPLKELKQLKNNIISLENETSLLGFDVVSIDNFFEKVSTKTLEKYIFDFNNLRLNNIIKVCNMFERFIFQDYVDIGEYGSWKKRKFSLLLERFECQ